MNNRPFDPEVRVVIAHLFSEPGMDDLSVLDDAERARAARFRFDKDRVRWQRSRALLRRVLGEALEQDHSSLNFLLTEKGKPYLEGQQLQFNVSHAGDYAAIAFRRAGRVGIDIEEVRSNIDAFALAERYFSTAESKRVIDSGQSSILAFYRIWTCKEALIKAVGEGLSLPLDGFDISSDPRSCIELKEDKGKTVWNVQDLEAPSGYVAALAAEGVDWRIHPI